jgi:serine O-acetyltransferase
MAASPENRIRDWRDCRAFIKADYHSRRGSRPVFEFLTDPIVRFLVIMRVLEWLENTGASQLLRAPLTFWFRRLSLRLGFTISRHVFGPGVALPHYGNIMIDGRSSFGRNCRVHVGAVVAGTAKRMDPSEASEWWAPIIGDNVYIAPGVKMNGPLAIADDCMISANSVVTRSFTTPGVTISGFPANIVALSGSQNMIVRGCDLVPELSAPAKRNNSGAVERPRSPVLPDE